MTAPSHAMAVNAVFHAARSNAFEADVSETPYRRAASETQLRQPMHDVGDDGHLLGVDPPVQPPVRERRQGHPHAFGSGHRVSDVAARHGTDHRVLDRRSDREVLLGASHRGQRYAAAVRRRADRGDNRRR